MTKNVERSQVFGFDLQELRFAQIIAKFYESAFPFKPGGSI